MRRSRGKVMAVCIWDGLNFSTTSVSIYHKHLSDIWVKSYGRPNLRGHSISTSSAMIYCGAQSDIGVKTFARWNSPESSLLNFECLDSLLNFFGDSGEKLWLFEFMMGFIFQLRASQYYVLQSNIRVKSYACPNLRGHSFSTFKRHDILWGSIGHSSQNFCSSEFARVFLVTFWVSQ